MTDTPPTGEPPNEPSPAPGPPPRPGPHDNWPDFSAPTGERQAPPTGPGPGPGPGQGPGFGGPGYGPPPGWQPRRPTSPSDERMLATLAHVGGIIAGFIPALIIYLIKKDESPYVRKEAAEALNFQITVTIASVISVVLMIVLIGIFLMMLVWVVNIVLCIVAAVAANRGEPYEYPGWSRIKMVS